MGRKPRFVHIGMDGLNYPLLRKFVREGCLPTFAELIERGTINRLTPSLPAWTPTNWAAQITGAQPGTHGLGGWSKHDKAKPVSAPGIRSWESREWKVETVWDVAEEAGLRSLITNFPVATWPSPVKDGYVLVPGFRDPPFVIANGQEYFLSPRVVTTSGEGRGTRLRSVDVMEEGVPPGSVALALQEAKGWPNLALGSWEATLPVSTSDGSVFRFHLLGRQEASGSVAIYERKGAIRPLVEVCLGEWSPFVVRDFGGVEGSARFRLLGSSAEVPSFHLVRSQVYRTQKTSYPEWLAAELTRAIGPTITRFSCYPRSQVQLEAFLDEYLDWGLWQVEAARYIMDNYGWDLHFCHWHLFDHINHPTVNDADPEGPNYDPELGEWSMEAQRQAYIVADKVLARFLSLAEGGFVMVISDHGMPPAHRWADINVRLAETGLMAFDPDSRAIDMSRSKAYTWPDRGAEVFVNLAGREPTGVVPPEAYESVQEQVLDALLDWRDPETGKRIVALALKFQDAQIIGYWGPYSGDVIFALNHGIGWGAVGGGQSVGPGRGAIHGSQMPTYETKLFSTMGTMLLAGPGIKQGGYERAWRKYGLMRQIDVAPTICHVLGLRMPAQNQGAVLSDLFS